MFHAVRELLINVIKHARATRVAVTINFCLRGIRVNEDVFFVHIRDSRGNLHTLQKSELATLDRELETTLMPSYASRITGGDLEDLVAYLSGLRGAR